MRTLLALSLVGCLDAPELSTTEQAVVPIDCSAVDCTSADMPLHNGYPMFGQANFDAIVDGFGRTRKFYVHIPASYDLVDGVTGMIPLIFAFHGGSQTREAMIAGKWGDDYFDQDYAFVIPLGEFDPCDTASAKPQWMQPGLNDNSTPNDPNCDPATQVVRGNGTPIAYWSAALPGTFTDVLFVEELRAMVLDRFPKLNPNKVYATGFSSGGGLTYTLACYRGSLFRGFSVVAKTLGGDGQRADYDDDGVVETDPDSIVATCGKNVHDPDRATGIATPDLWGSGQTPVVLGGGMVVWLPVSAAKPLALFVGDQDNPMQAIDDTGALIRDKNNVTGFYSGIDPFQNTESDEATTQRRTFTTVSNISQASAAFRRYLVQGVANRSATHAMPDEDECNRHPGNYHMTCDYNYTDKTINFWVDHADLSTAP